MLGAGRIGRVHADTLANHCDGVEVVACADIVPERAARLAEAMRIAQTFGDWRELVESADVDAIAVCTPSDTHYDVVMEGSKRGLQIFCEKPIDLDIAKIHALGAEVERSGVTLMVAFQKRFDPRFAALRREIADGAVGSPYVLRITSRDPEPPPESFVKSSGGIFMDMTVHDFDMSRFLLGENVTEVFARGSVLVDPMFARQGDWDTTAVTLTFESGALALIDNSRRSIYGYDQRLEIFGSKGMLTVDNQPDATGADAAALAMPFFMKRYIEAYKLELRAFAEAVRAGRPAPVGIADGLWAVEIGLAATKSAREGRPVTIAEIQQSHPKV